MMFVISLIVLGFAQVSRREQRQSLDRQLSSQAFFAAESGVNDARQKINDDLANGLGVTEKENCEMGEGYTAVPEIDTAVSYTCLLVTSKLKNLFVSPLTASGRSVVLPINPDSGRIDTMRIKWSALNEPSSAEIAQCPNDANDGFPQSSAWVCPYGVLRMDIVPTDSLSRADTTNRQKTIFLYPVKNGGIPSHNYADAGIDGTVRAIYCQPSAKICEVDIANMAGFDNYALRLSALYEDGSVDVTVSRGGTSVLLKNAQVQIDATGKAQDVLRRIQVRIPFTSSTNVPEFALQSGSSICKRFEASPAAFTIPAGLTGQDTRNPMCR
jgi:Tfp pilus assembly protein PilX